MAKRKIVKTKRLLITPWTDDQLREALYAATSAEEKRKYSEMLSGAQLRPDDRLWYTKWEITLRSDGTPIGEIRFHGPANRLGEVEISYLLLPEYRGKGYGVESVRELLDLAFQSDGVYFIMAEADDVMAQNLLKTLGFTETGRWGELGPRYELERPPSEKIKVLTSVGVSLGLMLGIFPLANLNAGILIGVFSGYAIGAYFEAKDRRIRENLRQKRK